MTMRTTVRPLARPQAVAEFLNVATRTLRAWRVEGRGPKFLRINARGDVRYRWEDVEHFIREKEGAYDAA